MNEKSIVRRLHRVITSSNCNLLVIFVHFTHQLKHSFSSSIPIWFSIKNFARTFPFTRIHRNRHTETFYILWFFSYANRKSSITTTKKLSQSFCASILWECVEIKKKRAKNFCKLLLISISIIVIMELNSLLALLQNGNHNFNPKSNTHKNTTEMMKNEADDFIVVNKWIFSLVWCARNL